MPYHDHGFSRFQWGAGSDDVFNQRAPAGSMQNLGQAGLKPRALSRSKDNNGKIVGRHKPIILREQNQFRNASNRRAPDRESTRPDSSHPIPSFAPFFL